MRDRLRIDLGHARLRALADRTITTGLPKLLWITPSLSYHQPGGPFVDADPITTSKHLMFSSWSATPTAVAALLSYTADRSIGTDPTVTTRLDFRIDDERPAAMTTLALFWPTPALATLCDPLALAKADPSVLAPLDEVVLRAASLVGARR